MINNPFKTLEIEPTTNKEIITQAYRRLNDNGGSEEYLRKLKVAYQNCLMYADSGGATDLFTDHGLN
jgi:hypothetical protein